MSLCVAKAGTTTASWDLSSASLAVGRSVSLYLSFCLVVLLCLVLSFCLVCLPCLSCLSASVCQSVRCVVCGACACQYHSPRLHEPLLFTSALCTSLLFTSPSSRLPSRHPQEQWMTMKRENNQELVQESSEAHSLGSSSLATRTQPWRFWSQCNLLGGSILITKEFTRFTEDFFIPLKSVMILWVVQRGESL